jgi:hypothetical protein
MDEDALVTALTGPLAESVSVAVFEGKNLVSVDLSLPVFRGGRDLFFFFLAVFSNGVGRMFGRHRAGPGSLYELTDEEFDAVDSKMRVMGVRCKRTMASNEVQMPEKKNNMEELSTARLDLPVERYRLTVIDGTESICHNMWFHLIHLGLDHRSGCAINVRF